MIKLRAILLTSSVLAFSSTAAMASMEEFWRITANIESSGDYSAMNDTGCLQGWDTCNASAMGQYQIMFGNWKSMGYVTEDSSGWHNVQFTSAANQYGVYNVDDLRFSSGGAALQDAAAGTLAYGMYNQLSSGTTSYVGQNVNGVTLNEAALLRGAWHLGPGGMNTWASSGFSAAGLAAMDPDGSILAANGYSSYEAWNASLMNQMAAMGDVDISELTGGTYVVGGGEYAGGGAALEDCAPEIRQMLADSGRQRVENVVAMAQDQSLGFSTMEQPMGVMSCIDFAFSGGLDIFFQVPNLSGLMSGLQDYACSQLNQMVGNQINQMTQTLAEVTSLNAEVPGFGPISGLGGVSMAFNQNTTGVNVYTGDANPNFSGIGSIGGSGGMGGAGAGSMGGMQGDGLDALFN